LKEPNQNESLLDRAILFAVEAHRGMLRKDKKTPYILHPMEAATIAGSMTSDPEILAAACLHDTVEDTPVTQDRIRTLFGERVADLVASETEDKRADLPPELTWLLRKEESLRVLKESKDEGVKILWLSDKLANMRTFYRSYLVKGNDLWKAFHQSDPAKQAWYYRSILELTASLSGHAAWKEYQNLLNKVFEGVN